MQITTSVPNPWPEPPTDAPVTRGSLLATNSPGGIPIKPLPFEVVAGVRLGAVDGWLTLDQARAALATLTDGPTGAAAIVREGDRFLGYAVEGFGLGFGDDFEPNTAITSPLRGRSGLFWRNDALVAVVDGDFVERFD